MLSISIPGRDELFIKNIVLDFNGTIATDGKLRPILKERIEKLRHFLDIYVLTADTYGTALNQCVELGVKVRVLRGDNGSLEKKEFVQALGGENTICIGNGVNDIGMFEAGALSILIIGDEGCSAKAIAKADIVVKNGEDALDLIISPKRITATLRE